MNEKKQYVAPELTVVSFKVEMGFSGSGTEKISLFHYLEDNDYYNAQNQENWYEETNFFDSW